MLAVANRIDPIHVEQYHRMQLVAFAVEMQKASYVTTSISGIHYFVLLFALKKIRLKECFFLESMQQKPCTISCMQREPPYGCSHRQSYDFESRSAHMPPFKHGFELHGEM